MRRRCSSSALGHCQSRLEGFEGTGLDYAGVKFVPCDYGSWEKRLFVLFGVIAWDFKAAVMVSGLVMDWILDNGELQALSWMPFSETLTKQKWKSNSH